MCVGAMLSRRPWPRGANFSAFPPQIPRGRPKNNRIYTYYPTATMRSRATWIFSACLFCTFRKVAQIIFPFCRRRRPHAFPFSVARNWILIAHQRANQFTLLSLTLSPTNFACHVSAFCQHSLITISPAMFTYNYDRERSEKSHNASIPVGHGAKLVEDSASEMRVTWFHQATLRHPAIHGLHGCSSSI
jgi:hypothetical protein